MNKEEIINYFNKFSLEHCFSIFIRFYVLLLFLIALILIVFHNQDSLCLHNFFVWDKNKKLKMILCLGLFIFYWFYYIKKNAKLKGFYNDNIFYCNLMLTTSIGIIYSSVHFLARENPDVHSGVKVWEVASYLVTFIYTFWLWFWSKKGRKILANISKDDENQKINTFLSIFMALTILLIITIIHFFITIGNSFCKGMLYENIVHYSVVISLFLINVVYMIFCKIDKLVIKYCKDDPFNQEFLIGLKYLDKPTLFIFRILLVYSFFTIYTKIEIFFSGAIAFELLLSSMAWANTETV